MCSECIGNLLDEVSDLQIRNAELERESKVVWFVIGGYFDSYYEDGPWATEDLAYARFDQLTREATSMARALDRQVRDDELPTKVSRAEAMTKLPFDIDYNC